MLAAACTSFRSVMVASSKPLTSASRATGAEITSANEPKQHRFQQFIVRQRFGPGLAETLAQALPMAVIVRRRLGAAAIVGTLLFQHGNDQATPPPADTPQG